MRQVQRAQAESEDFVMKRAVITGPTGAIGMALIEQLCREKTEVIAVVRPDSGRAAQIEENSLVHKVECDLKELSKLPFLLQERSLASADVFYHLAWEGTFGESRNDMRLQNANVRYALDAVAAAAQIGCSRFIGAGSQAEYGRREGKLDAQTPIFPENGYGIAKLCAGQMTRILCRQKGMEHIWTRILSIYGPYDGEHTMVTSVIDKLLSNEPAQCTKGEQQWDYLYSKDAAKAMYLLGEKGIDGKVYCIGSGMTAALRDYIDIIRQAVNPQADVLYGALPYQEGQVMYLCADIGELQKDTGFTPGYTFAEGIAETVCHRRRLKETGRK